MNILNNKNLNINKIMTNKADETIKKLFDVIQTKKAEIEKLDRPNWITNCSLPFTNGNLNLHTVSDPEKIVEAYASIILADKAHEEAANELGIKYKFKISGYAVGDWKTDLKTRLGKIQIKTKQDELSNLEKRLDGLVSPEMKRQLELDEIEKLLK
jgi:hypothetical protein